MTTVWKANAEIPEDIKVIPPRALIEKLENRCPNNVPETYISKNIPSIINKLEFKIVYDAAKELKNFTHKQLIRKINGEGITDGVLQHKVLSHMICLGIIKGELKFYKDEKGKNKPIYIYTFIEEEKRTPCKLLDKKCNFNWKEGKKTKFFQ